MLEKARVEGFLRPAKSAILRSHVDPYYIQYNEYL